MTAARKAPGFIRNPGKRIELVPVPQRMRVMFNGETVADSTRALLMHEDGHAPAWYFPMADVRMDLMTPTDNRTHCPYKGDASYWSIRVGGKVAENAVWSYRDPYQEMLAIRDYVSFYRDRVDSWWDGDDQVHPPAGRG